MGSTNLSRWLEMLELILITFGANRLPYATHDLVSGFRALRDELRREFTPVAADFADGEAGIDDHK